MQVSDLGGETVSNPPIVYALPSIARMEIVETSSGGTLTIFGRFPPQTGLVKVSDGTNSQTIIPSSWSTSQVVVTLPVAGLGSYGNVYVISTDGISSNAAPLTKWSGTITGVQNDTFTYMPGNAYATGTGTGTIVTSFTFDFRADVHPTVPSIDASPVPQNLYFAQPEADSVAQITSLTGSFTTSSSSTTSGSAAFGLSASAAPMPPAPPPIPDGTFGFGALPGQPATCNNGQPGPQPGPTNVFCAGIGYSAPSAGTCSNTGANPICASALWKATWVFGDPTRKDDGLLQLTMDPTTYAITLSATTATKADNNFESFPTSKTTLSGTIGPPMSPPNPLLPATVRRSMH